MLYLLTFALVIAVFEAKGLKKAIPQKLSKSSQHVPKTKIVNGEPTTNSAYPWIVSLRILGYDDNDNVYVDGGHFCGGSIIEMGDVPIILTAAHCVDGMQKELKQYEKDFKKDDGGDWDFDIYADIGRTNIHPYEEGTFARIEVANWYQHQDYDADTVANDIAIIALSDSIDLSDAPNATTVTYNVDTTLTSGEMLRVIGYGLNISSDISDNAGYTPTLQYTNISYVEASLCNQYQNLAMYIDENDGVQGILSYNWSDPDFSVLDGWKDYDDNIILDGMICGFDIDSDSCQGDSGGPVVNLPLNKDATQIGVVSWGLGCAWGVPGVYSSVDYYLDWVNGAKSCLSCTEDDDDNSLSYCKKTYTNCSDWVEEYGKPDDRYSSGSSHNSNDIIVVVAVILSIAVLCGVIVCVVSYVKRRRKTQSQNEMYTSLTGNQELTQGNM